MTDQGLRDALEKLADKYGRAAVGGGTQSYHIYADELTGLLAAHPAVPAPFDAAEDLAGALRKTFEQGATPVASRSALRAEVIRVIDKSLDTGALNPDDVVDAVLNFLGSAE